MQNTKTGQKNPFNYLCIINRATRGFFLYSQL